MLGAERLQRLRGFPRQLALENHAALADIRYFFDYVLFLQLQHRRDDPGEGPGVRHLAGRGAGCVGRGADGQGHAVPIQDRAPARRDAGFTGPLALRPLLVRVFPLTDSARDYLRFMLLVSSYYLVGQTVNTVVITGVFRAGGDTKFGMWCDTINMWCVSVPIGFLSAFVLHLPPKWVYFILCLDEFYKVPVEVVHYRKYKWLRNVTREEPFGPAEAEPD